MMEIILMEILIQKESIKLNKIIQKPSYQLPSVKSEESPFEEAKADSGSKLKNHIRKNYSNSAIKAYEPKTHQSTSALITENRRHNMSNQILNTENLVKRDSESGDIKINFGYKPPLHGNKRKFAAEMFKNRKLYFNRNPSTKSVNNSQVNNSSDGKKTAAAISTAKVRMSTGNRNYLTYDNQDATTVNETDSPGKPTAI